MSLSISDVRPLPSSMTVDDRIVLAVYLSWGPRDRQDYEDLLCQGRTYSRNETLQKLDKYLSRPQVALIDLADDPQWCRNDLREVAYSQCQMQRFGR